MVVKHSVDESMDQIGISRDVNVFIRGLRKRLTAAVNVDSLQGALSKYETEIALWEMTEYPGVPPGEIKASLAHIVDSIVDEQITARRILKTLALCRRAMDGSPVERMTAAQAAAFKSIEYNISAPTQNALSCYNFFTEHGINENKTMQIFFSVDNVVYFGEMTVTIKIATLRAHVWTRQ
jgi:hypothetical protein